MAIDIGQRTSKVFTLVNSGTNPSIPAFCDTGAFDCGFILPAYAYSGTDDLKNDKTPLLVMAEDWISSIVFILQKKVSDWEDKDTIADDTYGEYFPQGHWGFKPYYAGVILYWKNILSTFGAGEYRVKYTQTSPLGDTVSVSKTICLKEWKCPDNTVRLEWYNNKIIGDIDNDREILDFSDLNWYNQIRLPNSFFGHPKSEYEEEEIQYANGEFSNVTDVQKETYILNIGSAPAWIHNVIKTLAFQSGTLQITDYSSNNPQEIIRKEVKRSSAYQPRWIKGSKCAPVTVELKPTYNRLEIDRC